MTLVSEAEQVLSPASAPHDPASRSVVDLGIIEKSGFSKKSYKTLAIPLFLSA